MAQALKVLPELTVGTTAVQLDQRTQQNLQFRSITIQADDANTGQIKFGDSTVSASHYARSLNAHEWATFAGDAVVGSEIWVIASAAGQILHVSGF